MQKKRILIVGGVAGGASCAARARRLSETAEIVIFDRGDYVSFANCGLPYYVGDVIRKEDDLLVATPELFRERFNIEVRLQADVVAIDRNRQTISVKDLRSGSVYAEAYDALVLSPGATPIRPNLPGIDLPGIFSLRTIPDSRRIREWIDRNQAKRALIVGGGYIGMEMTENLVRRGLAVTVVEMQSQIMPLLDPEMAMPVQALLASEGVRLRLNETVTGFAAGAGGALRCSSRRARRRRRTWCCCASACGPKPGWPARPGSRWENTAASVWTPACGRAAPTSGRSATRSKSGMR